MQLATEHSTRPESEKLDTASAYVPGFDNYGPIHKGLRFTLCSLLTRLGTCAWDDAQATQMALDDLEGLLYLFAGHAMHEDRHVHVALEARRAGSTAVPGGAHERQERMIAELRRLAAAFANGPRSARRGLWRMLYLRFAEFAGENLIHMSYEELEMQPLLEMLYTRAELVQIQQRLLGSIGPEERLATTRLMVFGATRDERVALLSAIKAAAPPAVMSVVLEGLRAGLSTADHADLTERIG